jgi:hypothetical protein
MFCDSGHISSQVDSAYKKAIKGRAGPRREGRIAGFKQAGGFTVRYVNMSRITQVEQVSAEEPEEVCPQGNKSQYKVLVLQFGIWLGVKHQTP